MTKLAEALTRTYARISTAPARPRPRCTVCARPIPEALLGREPYEGMSVCSARCAHHLFDVLSRA